MLPTNSTRLQYDAKKAKKIAAGGGIIAKSNIILDVKPWDDETDLAEMERLVRSIEVEGLLWGACKFALWVIVPVLLLE